MLAVLLYRMAACFTLCIKSIYFFKLQRADWDFKLGNFYPKCGSVASAPDHYSTEMFPDIPEQGTRSSSALPRRTPEALWWSALLEPAQSGAWYPEHLPCDIPFWVSKHHSEEVTRDLGTEPLVRKPGADPASTCCWLRANCQLCLWFSIRKMWTKLSTLSSFLGDWWWYLGSL